MGLLGLIGVQEYQTDTWNDTAEYKYDAVGRRLLRVVTNKGDLNGTTRFIWGIEVDWQCLEERDGSDDLVARYTYAPGYIDAVAVQERDLNSDDDFGDDDEVVYYHSTTLYSIYALTDADENVIERYRYDAYGAATVLDADFSDDADGLTDVDHPYLFQGRRWDAGVDCYYFRNRFHGSVIGRFLARDALAEGGRNHYEFVNGAPGRFADPMGLHWIQIEPRDHFPPCTKERLGEWKWATFKSSGPWRVETQWVLIPFRSPASLRLKIYKALKEIKKVPFVDWPIEKVYAYVKGAIDLNSAGHGERKWLRKWWLYRRELFKCVCKDQYTFGWKSEFRLEWKTPGPWQETDDVRDRKGDVSRAIEDIIDELW